MKTRRSAGFSLIELLVAVAITVIVVAVALSALNDAQRTSEGVTLASNTQENLRAGMNYIARDLVLTGEGLPTGGISIPNNGGVPVNRPGPVGAGYTFPLAFTAVPAITTGQGLGANIGRPSDMITILYADNTITLNQNLINDPAPVPPSPVCNGNIDPAGASVTFDVNCTNLGNGTIAIRPGDLIMFSNVQGNALEMVTSVAGQQLNFAVGDPFALNQRNDPSGTMAQIQNPPGTYPPTTATRVIMVTYFVDNTGTAPRLMREVNFNAPQAVAEGIEDLQASYDFIDGAGNPTDQKSVPGGDSANQIQDVNLFLAARSLQKFSWDRKYFHNNLITRVSLRGNSFFNRYN